MTNVKQFTPKRNIWCEKISQSECKKKPPKTLECQYLSFTGQRDRSQRKAAQGTYWFTGREPTLTTSENNYKRSFFSLQQSCINQTMTQSIGIHLKRIIRVTENIPKAFRKLERQHCPLFKKLLKKKATANAHPAGAAERVQSVQVNLGPHTSVHDPSHCRDRWSPNVVWSQAESLTQRL